MSTTVHSDTSHGTTYTAGEGSGAVHAHIWDCVGMSAGAYSTYEDSDMPADSTVALLVSVEEARALLRGDKTRLTICQDCITRRDKELSSWVVRDKARVEAQEKQLAKAKEEYLQQAGEVAALLLGS